MPFSNTEHGRQIAVIFGIPFHQLKFEDALEDCKRSIDTQKPTYISNIDLEFAVATNQDEELKNIVFHAERVICRSLLITHIAKNFGITWLRKVRLIMLLPSILSYCENNAHSVYLFGSSFKELKKTTQFINRRYPNLKIVGTKIKPEGEMFDWDNASISQEIEKAKPSLLLCALGEENNAKWIAAHYRNYRANLSFPVGSDFRCIRGNAIRGEGYWEKFLSDPLYYVTQTVKDAIFLWKELNNQKTALQQIRSDHDSQPAVELSATHVFHKIIWQGKIEQLKLGEVPMPPDFTRNVVCECAGVNFIDSAGLGQLAHLTRTANRYGKFFCLYKPSDAITQSLKAMRLDKHIPTVWSQEALEDELKRHEESLVLIKVADNGHDYIVKPLVDLKQKSLQKVEKDILDIYPTLSKYGKIVLNLEYVDFLDSAAIGTILSIKNHLDNAGVRLKLEKVHGAPLKTLQALKLDSVLVAPVELEIV